VTTAADRREPAFTEPAAPRVTDAASDAAELRNRVAAVNRGAARAAVLGVNDGLVTNLCLILAVAGASTGVTEVRIAGLASLIAGALSMAAGEWISVRSQVELYEGIVGELRRLAQRNPRLLLEALVSKLEQAGLATDTAQRVSTELPLDGDKFIEFSSRTVFGFDTDDLGSPRIAALSSLALFSVGATVPLLPWFIIDGTPAVIASAVATGAASLVVGGWVGRSSDRPIAHGALRQLAIVIAASVVTYTIGKLFGTAVA
jgi:VIT1/CCC1 family predicted Fe2+/Mn2+ transporter